jgi:Flp pilus assembly protein TadG
MEYGSMFLRAQQVTNVARQAARLAATPDATTAQVHVLVNNQMQSAGLGSSGYQVTVTPSDVSSPEPGQLVTVRITVPYRNISITGGAPLLPGPDEVRAAVSMAKEGPGT